MSTRRAIRKGVISFDNISIPVKLYSAVEPDDLAFHLLHDQDRVRLKYQLICQMKDDPVPENEVVKGLQITNGKYVLIEPGDFEQIKPECSRGIEVTGFVKPDEVNPLYFIRPYHLGADGEAQKYASLAKALEKNRVYGLCRWCSHNRFYNGLLISSGGILELITLRLAAEIRNPKELNLPRKAVTEKEKTTARYLVDELTSQFKPSEYKNEFHGELKQLIETKARGGKIKPQKGARPKVTRQENLLKALEASLESARSAKTGRA